MGKRDGTFTCCDVLVPGEIPNWTLLCSDSKTQKKTKQNILRFSFLLFVFATETWAKRASTRLSGGSVSDGFWLQRENTGVYTVACVCVRVHECVCWCVNGQLVNTFLGTTLTQPVLWGNVQMLCGLAKETNLADVLIWTREWKNCPFPCVIVVPFKDVGSNRGDHHSVYWPVEPPGVLVLHVLKSAGRRLCSARSLMDYQWEKYQHKGDRNTEHKHCSQTNRLNLQKSQLELNCESGITLYIKKEKQSCSFSSRCFLPPF